MFDEFSHFFGFLQFCRNQIVTHIAFNVFKPVLQVNIVWLYIVIQQPAIKFIPFDLYLTECAFIQIIFSTRSKSRYTDEKQE